jgi:Gluconolactonase
MSARHTRFIHLFGLVFALFIAGLSLTSTWAASVYQNGQKATLVLGQPDFLSNPRKTTQSGMYYPISISIDPVSKKVFVADTYNNRVLRFASFDSLSNGANAEAVLGQPDFTSSSLDTKRNRMNQPQGVVVDFNGTLWVADTGNHRVLRFDAAASKPSGADADGVLGQDTFTSADGREARNRMTLPASVTIDQVGTLWVADTYNHRVLRFDAAASKPNGADADGVLGQADFNTKLPGVGANKLYLPRGVAIQDDGTLWVADSSNHRVLRFNNAIGKANGANADGVLGQVDFDSNTTAANEYKIFMPTGIAIDSNGSLWVSASDHHRVLRFDNASAKPNGAAANGVLGQANFTSTSSNLAQDRFEYPTGIAIDDDNAVWVTDTKNSRVLRFNSLITQTIDFGPLSAKTFGDPPFNISATATSGLPVSFTSLTSSVCSVSGNSVSLLSDGTCTIRANQAGDSMIYAMAESVDRSFKVKAVPVISWDTPAAITYGTALSASQLNATANVAGSFSYNVASGTMLNSGSYTLTATFTPDDTENYAVAQKSVSLTVNKAPLTITAQNASRNYGEANPSFSVSYSGFVNGEDESVLNGSLSITTSADSNSPAGSYPIVASGLTSNNYEISFINGTLTINKVPLTITAHNASRDYGAANPSFSVSYSGFVNSEDESALGGSLQFSSASIESPAGEHPIVPSGLTSNNYEISFVNGTLTINKAPLTITAQNASRSYGAADPSFSVSYNGFVNDEDESVLGGALVFSSTNTSSPVGSYPITPSGLSSSNYDISFVDGTLTVTKAPLTITAQNASKIVDQPNPSFGVNYSGFVNGEDENVLTGNLVITTTAVLNSPVGMYPIVPSGLSGDNYEISFVNGTLTIDPSLAITWNAPSAITYGTALSTSQLNASANIAGSFTYKPALGSVLPAGTHTITATFTPADSRYSSAQQTMLLTVNKAPLTITAQNATRVEGEANPSFSVSYSGFVNGENASVLGGTLVLSTSANASSPAGTYSIVPSGLTSNNYTITYVNGTLIVQPKPVTQWQTFLPFVSR